MAHAVISALNQVSKQSKETTVQALYDELRSVSELLLSKIRSHPNTGDRTLLSMRSLMKIYMRMAQRVDQGMGQGIDEIRATI